MARSRGTQSPLARTRRAAGLAYAAAHAYRFDAGDETAARRVQDAADQLQRVCNRTAWEQSEEMRRSMGQTQFPEAA